MVQEHHSATHKSQNHCFPGYKIYLRSSCEEITLKVVLRTACRRKFTDVIKASSDGKQGRAHIILKIIVRLCDVEREAKEMCHQDYYKLRQTKAKPILTTLDDML